MLYERIFSPLHCYWSPSAVKPRGANTADSALDCWQMFTRQHLPAGKFEKSNILFDRGVKYKCVHMIIRVCLDECYLYNAHRQACGSLHRRHRGRVHDIDCNDCVVSQQSLRTGTNELYSERAASSVFTRMNGEYIPSLPHHLRRSGWILPTLSHTKIQLATNPSRSSTVETHHPVNTTSASHRNRLREE